MRQLWLEFSSTSAQKQAWSTCYVGKLHANIRLHVMERVCVFSKCQIRACLARSCHIKSDHLKPNELSVIPQLEDICVGQSDPSKSGHSFSACSLNQHNALSAPILLMFNITSLAFISVTLLNPPLIQSCCICGACYYRLWCQSRVCVCVEQCMSMGISMR